MAGIEQPMNEADHTEMVQESWRWIAVILITLALHFAWEMAQGNLYLLMHSMPFWRATAFCARATAGDLVITTIAFSAAAMSRGWHWPLLRRRLSPTLIFLTVGMLITVVSEIYAVSTGRWAYDERMPQIFGIGLSPLLQWIVIPLLEIAAFRKIWQRARIDPLERTPRDHAATERSMTNRSRTSS
jgi:hypothetical protein